MRSLHRTLGTGLCGKASGRLLFKTPQGEGGGSLLHQPTSPRRYPKKIGPSKGTCPKFSGISHRTPYPPPGSRTQTPPHRGSFELKEADREVGGGGGLGQDWIYWQVGFGPHPTSVKWGQMKPKRPLHQNSYISIRRHNPRTHS